MRIPTCLLQTPFLTDGPCRDTSSVLATNFCPPGIKRVKQVMHQCGCTVKKNKIRRIPPKKNKKSGVKILPKSPL